ncbi:tetratricopeptide repeat protein [Sphingomonas oryzagri]
MVGQGQGISTVATPVSTPSPLDYISALGGLALPITAFLIFAILVFFVAAVAFRWFEIDATWGKLTLKVHRPYKAGETNPILTQVTEGVSEEQSSTPLPEIHAQASGPAQQEASDSEPDFMAYFRARTVPELDQAYPVFSADMDADSHEFWETDYRSRRAKYGADNGRDGVRKLVTEHPTWAYPHAILLEWSLADHDVPQAEEHLSAGLSRHTSPQFGHVLSAGVKLRFQSLGARAATEFCAEWSVSQIPERIKAGAFLTLAELLKEAGDAEGQRVALEWAVALQPSDRRKIFSLGYSYGEHPGRWASSMWHYRRILGADEDGPVARNNFGVILGNFDKRLQIEEYEQASKEGDKYAIANIANLLIADGFVSAGERLLEAVDNPGSAAELHASALKSALAARRAMLEKRVEIDAAIDSQSGPFRKSLSQSFRYLQSKEQPVEGYFVSDDKMFFVILKMDGANCIARIANTDLSGDLRFQGTCYGGKISDPNQSWLGLSYDVTLLVESRSLVRLFQWPSSSGQSSLSSSFVLNRVDVPPPPLPPIDVKPPTALGNLLAIGKSAE